MESKRLGSAVINVVRLSMMGKMAKISTSYRIILYIAIGGLLIGLPIITWRSYTVQTVHKKFPFSYCKEVQPTVYSQLQEIYKGILFSYSLVRVHLQFHRRQVQLTGYSTKDK